MSDREVAIADLQKNIYCRLLRSPIQGVGVFAIRPIPKGTNPFVTRFDEDFICVPTKDIKDNPKIAMFVQQLVKDMCVEDKGDYYLPMNGLNSIGIAWFLNHSTTPNMEAVGEGIDFIANRDIAVGEELTVNYGTYGELNLG